MYKLFSIIFSILLLSVIGFTQDVSFAPAVMKGFQTVQNPDFGTDILVSSDEPAGIMAGLQRGNGNYYVAINDTTSTTNLGIVVFRSTNFGLSWTMLGGGIQPKLIFRNMKMVSTSTDSLYLFFMAGTDVYRWNIINNSFGKFTGDSLIRSFDVVSSSTGSLYIFYDRNYNTNIRRFGSTDGGFTWGNSGSVTSSGVYPKLYMSGSGDTLILNYYGPVLSDTMTSVIRAARYRETAPGTLSSSGFQNVAIETVVKSEYSSVFKNGIVWFIYTTGTTGDIDIKCTISSNSGANYSAAVNLAANPNVDEYWFSARHYFGGLDIFYYSDSLQAGPPTNNTDKILYKWASATTPGTFSTTSGISEHPPGWSQRNYRPVCIEDYTNDHYGVVWVGLDGSIKKVYFEGDNITSVRNNENLIADKYFLSQNYPNPFNPVTKINFAIPKSGFVTLKVYDILGKEIKTLVSRELNNGSYTVDFDASKLSTGIYFYRINVNGFSDVKKMSLIK